MIHAIRCYQPVSIPGLVSMNMVSKKQVNSLNSITKVDNGFLLKGSWVSKWDDKNVTFDVYVPESNVQFAYILSEEIKQDAFNLNDNFSDLRERCKELNIPLPQNATKQKLVDLLDGK